MYDPKALADTETYLIDVLEHSDPRREASAYHITRAAQDFHDTSGGWDIRSADPGTVEDVLARHAK